MRVETDVATRVHVGDHVRLYALGTSTWHVFPHRLDARGDR